MAQPSAASATDVNREAFDAAWTRGKRLKARFQYNIESARKEFVGLLDDLQIGRTGQRVLDVGFGSGMLMFEFDPASVIRGVELSKSALATAEERARKRGYRDYSFVTPSSPERLPYDDAQFTVVIASHVVEHIEDDIGFVRELLRVLAPGGWLIVIGPIDNLSAGLLDDATLANPEFVNGHYHVRNYNPETFLLRLAQAGAAVRRSVLSMETWDWKVQNDVWRARLAGRPLGRLLDRGIAAAINLPLALAPLGALRLVDRFWARRGYHARQIAVAAQRA